MTAEGPDGKQKTYGAALVGFDKPKDIAVRTRSKPKTGFRVKGSGFRVEDYFLDTLPPNHPLLYPYT